MEGKKKRKKQVGGWQFLRIYIRESWDSGWIWIWQGLEMHLYEVWMCSALVSSSGAALIVFILGRLEDKERRES